MGKKVSSCLWITPLLVALGCATFEPPAIDPADCGRAQLAPAPLWTASTIWSRDGSRLMLIDPRTRSLLAYSRRGQLAESVELDPMSSLDYATPIRLQHVPSGYVIGDRSRLVWLDPELNLMRVETLSDLGDGIVEGQLSDFALSQDRLHAYVDLRTGDEVWQRGFARFAGPAASVQWLVELPIEPNGEFSEYYHYDRRPYIAEDRGKIYLLRFTAPPTLHRLEKRRLRKIFMLDAEPELEAMALHSWQGSLYLVLRGPAAAASEPGLEAPELSPDSDVGLAQLKALMLLKAGYRWWLLRIDPKSGRTMSRIELPSNAQRLQIVPGEPSWGLIEESVAPNMDEENSTTTLLLLPSSWLTGRRMPQDVVLACDRQD